MRLVQVSWPRVPEASSRVSEGAGRDPRASLIDGLVLPVREKVCACCHRVVRKRLQCCTGAVAAIYGSGSFHANRSANTTGSSNRPSSAERRLSVCLRPHANGSRTGAASVGPLRDADQHESSTGSPHANGSANGSPRSREAHTGAALAERGIHPANRSVTGAALDQRRGYRHLRDLRVDVLRWKGSSTPVS